MSVSAHDRREATNVEVVVWALALLNGSEEDVHLEDIAVKAFGLKRGAFRWDQLPYSTFIDKDKVRVSLTDAAKPDHGGLARPVGRKIRAVAKPTDWWRLTAAGIRWVADNQPRLSALFSEVPPAMKREVARRVRKGIQASELYGEFIAVAKVTSNIYRLADLVECSPDARASLFQERFENLRAQVIQLGDPGLESFMDAVKQAHLSVLGEG